MENTKNKGRRKIPLKKIEKQGDQYATFSKRRTGLYKKASELVIKCDVDIDVIIFPPIGNPFLFFHPTIDAVVSRFQNPDMQLNPSTHLVAAYTRNRANRLNNKLEEFHTIENAAIVQNNLYDEVIKTNQKGRIVSAITVWAGDAQCLIKLSSIMHIGCCLLLTFTFISTCMLKMFQLK
ncbi:hypothetical protein RND71_037275 [Anisodus tanguticus]|uniref:MADS-box domain-containing protein n=1 Tax=Anisodus tanguticus TaxID=243964 RepID=A0AAE1R3C9_9SOLA|nr:hypothetical protein RND71_037275 [Anisodus tanguticus]